MRKILAGLVAWLWATAAFAQVGQIPLLTGPQDLGNVINSLNQTINKVNSFRGLQFVASLQASTTANFLFSPLPTIYNDFFISCDGIQPQTSGQVFYLQYVESGTIKSNSYNYQNLVTLDNTAAFNAVQSTGDQGIHLGLVDVTGTGSLNLKIWVSNTLSGSLFKATSGQSEYQTTGPHHANSVIGGVYAGDTTQITGFNLKFALNAILVGACSVYGIAQ